MALPNIGMSFSPFAILTADEMNNLVENIDALAAGTGFTSDIKANSITGITDVDSGDIYGITVTNGQISNPYKFNAHKSTPTNLTGVTSDTVVFDIEVTDTNNNYNASTGNYTIPVTGFYLFTAHCRIDSGSSVLKQIFIAGEKLSVYDGANQCVIGGSIMKQFTAGDTVSVTLYHGGSVTIVAD